MAVAVGVVLETVELRPEVTVTVSDDGSVDFWALSQFCCRIDVSLLNESAEQFS